MSPTRLCVVFLAACVAMSVLSNGARAGAIAMPFPTMGNGGIVGPGLGFGNIVAIDVTGTNNDNKNIKGNSFVSMDLSFANRARIDTVFTVANTGGFVIPANPDEAVQRNAGGTTEYWYEAVIVNNTGMAWGGIRFELGFGTGNNFVLSNTRDFLDFDTPDKDPQPNRNGGGQNQFNHQSNTLTWTGQVNGVQAGAFFYMFDVPDRSNEIPVGARTANGFTFTLRTTPLAPAPEPSVLILCGFGAVGLVCSRRRAAPGKEARPSA